MPTTTPTSVITPPSRINFRDAASLLRRYVGPHKIQMAALAGILVLSVGLSVVAPLILGAFVNRAVSRVPESSLVEFATAYLMIAVLAGLLWIASEYLGARVAWQATNSMRADLLEHCLGLDMRFYEEHTVGELIERIDGDVGVLSGYFSDMFLVTMSNLLLLAGIGIALFVENWLLGLCYIPFIAGSAFFLRRLVGVALPASSEQRRQNALLIGFLEERLSGLEDLCPNGAASYARYGFWLCAAGLMTAGKRAARLGVRWPAAAQALASLSLILALLAGSALYFSHAMTLGSVYVLIAYAGMLQAPLMMIVMQFQDLESSIGSLHRVGLLFGERSTLTDGTRALAPNGSTAGLSVEVDRASFSYRPGEQALRDICLRVEPGKRLAMAGRTGSGKSTMARLLFRFADPTKGRILLDGLDLRESTIESVRAHVGLVSQEVQIFHGPVRDNVTLFDPAAPDERVTEVLDEAGLGDWLRGLPDGLDTVLGAGAIGLSGGEAQLLAFARILLSNPSLVVLDEASSRLDPASRIRFNVVQNRLLADRTAVIITHDPGSLKAADRVVVLADGKIVADGDPEGLLSDPDSALSTLLRTGGELA
jgi:ATP-binding cassette, subfamily B, bacterial